MAIIDSSVRTVINWELLQFNYRRIKEEKFSHRFIMLMQPT